VERVAALTSEPEVVVAQAGTAVRAVAAPVLATLGAVVLHDEVLPHPRYPDLGAGGDLLGGAGKRDRVVPGADSAGTAVDLRERDSVTRRRVVPPAIERQE